MTAPPPSFPYGIASFEPTDDRVLLWAAAPGATSVRYEVAEDPEFGDVLREGEAPPMDGADVGQVLVDVDGLAAGTTYHYRFVADGVASPIGRTRTLPSTAQAAVRLGVVCCAQFSAGHFGAYRALATDEVDLVLHIGDYIYAEEGAAARTDALGHVAVTLDDYRSRYLQARSDPDLQALHQSHPFTTIWDDHDVADNAWRDGAPAHDPERDGPWPDRVRAACEARAAWVPVRPDPDRGPEAAAIGAAQWRSFTLGSVADVVVLDARQADRDQQADGGGPALDAPERSLLGAPQRAWAHDQIARRDRPWTLVVSSVVVSSIRLPVGTDARIDEPFPAGYLVEDGYAFNSDGWDGYPAERAGLTAAMRRRGGGAVVLSGDVHSSWAFEGPSDDEGPVAVEFTCPAVTSQPMGEMVPVGGRVVEALLEAAPHVRWNDLFHHGYLTLDLDAAKVVASWWFVDPADPAAAREQGATWVVEREAPTSLVPGDEALAARVRGDATALAPTGVPTGQSPDPGRPVLPDRPAGVGQRERRRRRRRRVAALGVLAVGAAVMRSVLDRRA